MVRRRATKAADVAAVARIPNENAVKNVGELKASSCSQLEEHYFASPKRKDCKVVENTADPLPLEEQEAAASAVFSEVKNQKANTHTQTSATGKTKCERSNVAGRTIGVPLATRSQTRTIENFFKAKTAANNATMTQEFDELQNLQNGVTIATSDSPTSSSDALPLNGYIQSRIPEVDFDISEDTNDTDHTDDIDEKADEAVLAGDFSAHRSLMRDSHSSRSSTSTSGSNTENIFLQEPVLSLNFDKTPNQASSIKINRSFEVEPIFSLPHPHTLSAVLNGCCFNQIVTLNGNSLNCKRESLSFESQSIALLKEPNDDDDVDELVVPDNDNSSCDSGVAFTTSLNNDVLLTKNDTTPVGDYTGSTRRRKPATPHRILCPSPIKASARAISPAHSSRSPPSYKSRELLSPRKSPRQVAFTNSKSRRRLNHQKEFNTKGMDKERINGCKKLDDFAIEAGEDELNFENLGVTDLFKAMECKKEIVDVSKKHERIKLKTHTQTAKMQQKSKLQPAGLPLATTNGNRELTEFFPVRRSVRKTKTAVKEEMLRNLEQAILEERADGLKIAYFEGKGRGIIADRHFERGEFVVEYVGDLISMTEATERETRYALDENAGCYMYYFKHKNQQYCIDATEDTGKLGRLVNHSRNGNLVTKVVVVKQRPHLILIAKDNIEPGEELTYDYGDRSKESLLHHPWLAF